MESYPDQEPQFWASVLERSAMLYFRRGRCLFVHEGHGKPRRGAASGTMSVGFPSCSTSGTDANVTVSPERRVERFSSREQEVAQNVRMTYMAMLQDALQETVVAIGDVIKVQASELWKLYTMHGSTFFWGRNSC